VFWSFEVYKIVQLFGSLSLKRAQRIERKSKTEKSSLSFPPKLKLKKTFL
jgi:hypothetical protein